MEGKDWYFPKYTMKDKKEMLQRCARGIYAEKLRNAGFVSYKGEDLSWYKVVNSEIVQTVYLFSSWGMTPLLIQIGYGVHPLFIPAPIPQKIIFNESSNDEVMQKVFDKEKHRIYDSETCVMCCNTKEMGAELLDTDVFPIFKQAKTKETTYEFHKQKCLDLIRRIKEENPNAEIQIMGSNWLVDEVIYFDDNNMQEMLLNQLYHQKEWLQSSKIPPQREKRLTWLCAQLNAIEDGKREEFLELLEGRKKRFIGELQRKLGIAV